MFYIEVDGKIRAFDEDERKLRVQAKVLRISGYEILKTKKKIHTDNLGNYFFKGDEPKIDTPEVVAEGEEDVKTPQDTEQE